MTENTKTAPQNPTFWARFRAAQATMRDPVKDATNPHFRSRFVTLKGVLDAIRPALHAQGLAISQRLDATANGACVVTSIRDDGGAELTSVTPILCAKPNDPQAFGSAATYARRYAAAAICCLAPADDDDDAESAVPDREQHPAAPPPPAKPPARKKAAPAAAPAGAGGPPKAAPYESLEDAGKAIAAATSQAALQRIALRIAAMGLLDDERKWALEVYGKRWKELGTVAPDEPAEGV